MKRIWFLFHLIKDFFVINEEEVEDWIYTTRVNTLALVKQGFTRDEIYFMPINEMQDYVKIINDSYEKEQYEINKQKNNTASTINDLKMAGNSLPGGFF